MAHAQVYTPQQAKQDSTLSQAEQDSAIAVVSFFSKNDTVDYVSVNQKFRLKNNDTIYTKDIVNRFRIVVADSTREGYLMRYIPLSYDNMRPGLVQLIDDYTTLPLRMECRFRINEMGAIQRIDNWMEIRDNLKASYKTILDSVYRAQPQLEDFMPRQRVENLLLLRCSTEEGILNLYTPLKMMFSLHGTEFATGEYSMDDTENGFPKHIDMTVGYTKPLKETDIEGDYLISAETTTDMKAEDLFDVIGAAIGMIGSDSITDQVTETYLSKQFGNMKLQGHNLEYYAYFYNGWPKLVFMEKRIKGNGETLAQELFHMEWSAFHWNVWTEQDDDSGK